MYRARAADRAEGETARQRLGVVPTERSMPALFDDPPRWVDLDNLSRAEARRLGRYWHSLRSCRRQAFSAHLPASGLVVAAAPGRAALGRSDGGLCPPRSPACRGSRAVLLRARAPGMSDKVLGQLGQALGLDPADIACPWVFHQALDAALLHMSIAEVVAAVEGGSGQRQGVGWVPSCPSPHAAGPSGRAPTGRRRAG